VLCGSSHCLHQLAYGRKTQPQPSIMNVAMVVAGCLLDAYWVRGWLEHKRDAQPPEISILSISKFRFYSCGLFLAITLAFTAFDYVDANHGNAN